MLKKSKKTREKVKAKILSCIIFKSQVMLIKDLKKGVDTIWSA
jgi:hypothetical protein